MIGLVFSHPETAIAFLNASADGRVDPLDEGASMQQGPLLVSVVGRGKIHATLRTERLLVAHEVDRLVHTGACVALSDEIENGTLIGATSVLEGDRVELDAPTYPQMPLSLPFDTPAEGVLVSQDHVPTGDSDVPGYWARLADVRDDTGYAVAYVAAQHGTPCHIAKVATGRDAEGTALSGTTQEAIVTFARHVAAEASAD
jgi:nucleoside phosphorylase